MKSALAAAEELFDMAREAVENGDAEVAERTAAVNVLGRGRDQQEDDLRRIAGLLTPESPTALQVVAVDALGRFNRRAIPMQLLSGWTGYTRAVREKVVSVLVSRPAWTHVLLDRASAETDFRLQIGAAQRAVLLQHGTSAVAERAKAIFGGGAESDRQKAIDRTLGAIPRLVGNPERGRGVFMDTCSACHRFAAVPGGALGPDLAIVNDRSPGYLVTHILDPNRALEDRFTLYTATTQDGRQISGMLTAEADNAVTLRGWDDIERVILRRDLRWLVSSGRSLMPEGLEATINDQAMADLIAFLAGSTAP